MNTLDDAIVAITSPPGRGGVASIRISGEDALKIFNQVFSQELNSSHQVVHGWIKNPDKSIKIDEVLAYYLAAPNSYTGENTVEISCHGGIIIAEEILKILILAGARLARNGEFTKRAFLNGKIDLTKAEAVIDLISAKSSKAREAAVAQLEGRLGKKIRFIRKSLAGFAAEIEAGIDFPDDVGERGEVSVREAIEGAVKEINALLATAEEGMVLREGTRLAIIGKPNVGKSSLLNALLGEERAIVTQAPGTTRDTIEEKIIINELPFVIIDTAGIRQPNDEAEKIGIERGRMASAVADINLMLYDATANKIETDYEAQAEGKEKTISVLNKIDLVKIKPKIGFIMISAKTGEGLEELKNAIYQKALKDNKGPLVDGVAINVRHKECLMRCKEALEKALEVVSNKLPIDLVALELHSAIIALGEINGEAVSAEIIDSIFERFCVGK